MLFKEGARYDGFDWAIANAIAKRIGVDTVVIVPAKYSELPGCPIAARLTT
jgi:ABC-type amino acid transport substrate-binding protein